MTTEQEKLKQMKEKEKEDEAKLEFMKPQKVVGTYEFGGLPEVKVKLREFEGAEKVNGARLLEGFSGFSITPVICANFIVDALELPLIAVITSEGFPARCVIDKGQPAHSIRLFGNSHIVVILSEIKLGPGFVYSVMEALLDFCTRREIKLLISIEGIPMDKETQMKVLRRIRRPRSRPPSPAPSNINDLASLSVDDDDEMDLFFLTSSEELHKKMKEPAFNCRPVPSGIIDGLTGALLAETVLRPGSPEMLCLLAPSHPQLPDAQGAISVVRILCKLLDDVSIDLKPLEEKAVEIEAIVSQVLLAAQPAQQKMNPATQMMYT
eukprot:c4515_g1_i1.p1 GENE.c4515_g1_i1~~c4515_g1_i1.p1  ORF type:complete len:347 (+),score=72.34 c4515_g1_i1:75-1043(+)